MSLGISIIIGILIVIVSIIIKIYTARENDLYLKDKKGSEIEEKINDQTHETQHKEKKPTHEKPDQHETAKDGGWGKFFRGLAKLIIGLAVVGLILFGCIWLYHTAKEWFKKPAATWVYDPVKSKTVYFTDKYESIETFSNYGEIYVTFEKISVPYCVKNLRTGEEKCSMGTEDVPLKNSYSEPGKKHIVKLMFKTQKRGTTGSMYIKVWTKK